MFSGTKITIEGEDFIVPPLSLGQLRGGLLTKLQEHDTLLAAGKHFETYMTRGEVILAALRRNYPDFSEEKLYNYLDLGNLGELWLKTLGVSGFMPGEEIAAEDKSNGTSSPSTEA